jgi:hypothetical protein
MLDYVRAKIKEYRKIEYLLEKYPEIINSEIIEAIKEGNYDKVKSFYKIQLSSDLDNMGTFDLRNRARILGIYGVSRLNKAQLIMVILNESCKH